MKNKCISKGINEKIIVLSLYFFGLIIILFAKNEMPDANSELYYTCVFAYIIILGLFCLRILSVGFDLFEPIVLITFLYSFIFVFEPIIDLIQNSTLWFGHSFIQYGVKSTWISILGYLAFFIAYSYNNSSLTKAKFELVCENNKNLDKRLALAGLLLWLVGYSLSVTFLLLTGKSMPYILTGGLFGSGDLLECRNVLGSLSMFSYTLIGSWALYFVYGKHKLLKVVLFVLTAFVFYLRGYRFIIIIFALVPIVIYYLRKNKRPRAISVILGISIIILFVGYVAVVRTSVRYGIPISLENFSWDSAIGQVKENFKIYNTYYALVGLIPSEIGYFHGQQMFLYTIIMFIPRMFWANKPLTSSGLTVIGDAISPYAVSAGTAYPIIGEYYLEFGIAGVIIFMFLYGALNRFVLKKYQKTKSQLFLISYAILLLSNFQIVIRGYTPSNFYMIVFFLLPLAIARIIERRTT